MRSSRLRSGSRVRLMLPKCTHSTRSIQPLGNSPGSNARSALSCPMKKYCGGDASCTMASSGGFAERWVKRRSNPAASLSAVSSSPNRSRLTLPAKALGRPSVATTRATFQSAPPARDSQRSGPVRMKSVNASPALTNRGQAFTRAPREPCFRFRPSLLLAQVRLPHLRVVEQGGRRSGEGDQPAFHDVATATHLQRQLRILLHQQDRDALGGHFPYGLENTLHHERREPHARLVQKQQPGRAHQRTAD